MFILPFTIQENSEKIPLKDPMFTIGSCFAYEIGAKLAANKFDAVTNPFGTIYNPHSILKNIRSLVAGGLDPENYIKSGDIYYHWDTHGALSGTDLSSLQQLLKDQSHELKDHLLKSNWLIITLGTARVYRYLHTDHIVANCHKVPGREFDHFLLTPSEIVNDYLETIGVLRAVNPKLKVILSVSPVRHVRDGLFENNVSKAVLLQAANEIIKNDEHTFYFPAYELMMDVLRDYRFYESDMIHPTAQAVDYIWERFMETFMDKETRDFVKQWAKIRKALAHRPFHPTSSSHQAFLKATIKQLHDLKSKVDVTSELNDLQKQLV